MNKQKIFLDKGFIAGTLAVLFGGGMAIAYGEKQGVYPLIVFALTALLGVLSIVQACRAGAPSPAQRISLRELAVLVLLFGNPLLAKNVGFYLAAALSVFAIMLLFDPPKSGRQALRTAAVTVCSAAGVYLVFTVLLRIATPRGFLI